MNRRHFIAASGAAAAGTVFAADKEKGKEEAHIIPNGVPLTQEPLAFEYAALEPHIDAKTMEIHYSKHHVAYITNLTKALDEAKLKVANAVSLIQDIPSLPTSLQTVVRNNGGGHVNHTLFWRWMRPEGKGPKEPTGKFAEAIQSTFGGLDGLKKAMNEAAMKRFGSGWAWLVYNSDKKLVVTSTANQDNPMMKGIVPDAECGRPLFGVDVWEHAYYLKYQNKRQDYLTAWWSVVNWERAERNYALVTS
ncbi:Fe-Mn family superoxide dismutase [Roseimicrobium gellanilyticum]|uniref:Superoxide dismutase n=1 Tax=Roseimicrobium gellanilyticum TaxID=748857 RepID=A0A366HHW0_9BACT|nr:superoxide dismutase [Roseimicrobium gellanilyticum]RBP42346.1 Fe-Mn family superoxide dismutase [Roseimicrobium gellanilyticum]